MDEQLDFEADPGGISDLPTQTARFQIARARQLLEQGGKPYTATRACKSCGSTDGIFQEKNGQNTVHCRNCGRHIYNAPKDETGQRARTVATVRRSVKPSQQARIFDRDQGRCVLCGATEQLTIGHLLSMEEAYEIGEVGPEVHDDANLAAMCEACNLGLGRHSISPRTYAVIMHRLVKAEIARRDPRVSRPTAVAERNQQATPQRPR